MDAAVQKFLEYAGILGPIIIFLGIYIILKDKQIKALQKTITDQGDRRVADAQQVNEGLMELNDKWMAALTQNTAALNEMRTVLMLIREDRNRARSRPPPGGE